MNYYDYDSPYDDERQFNLPGYLWGQFFGPQFPGGGQQPGFTPPGQSGGFPGYPGGGYPGGGFPGQSGGGQQQGAPTTPPPAFTPQQQQFQAFAIDPGAIRNCLFRFTYVWLNNGNAFWFYPTFVGRNSISGFRWRGNRWVFFGIDLNRISSFQCY